MPLDSNLNFNFSPADQDTIHAAIDAALAVFRAPSTPYVNLTPKERKHTPSINAGRMPYVSDAVTNILPVFTDLESPSIPLPRTITLWDLVLFLQTLTPKLAELNDRAKDMEINADNLVLTSMYHSYNTSKRQEGRVPGADVLLAAIAPLFAKHSFANRATPEKEEP